MSILEAFKLAFQSLWGNKMRSILTLIGVVMGVASVIMVLTLVQGAKRTSPPSSQVTAPMSLP